MTKYLHIVLLLVMMTLLNHVTGKKLCTSGKFFDNFSGTCKTCSLCPEITKRLCHMDKDTVCGYYQEIHVLNIKENKNSLANRNRISGGITIPARAEKTRDVEIARQYRWHNLTLALTCILCTLSTILLVLLIVACRMHRKSRMENNIYKSSVPVYHDMEKMKSINPKHIVLIEAPEKISLVTDEKLLV